MNATEMLEFQPLDRDSELCRKVKAVFIPIRLLDLLVLWLFVVTRSIRRTLTVSKLIHKVTIVCKYIHTLFTLLRARKFTECSLQGGQFPISWLRESQLNKCTL